MNFRRVIALSNKEFIQIRRDARSLALAIFIPVLLIILFGFALTLDVDRVPMIIWDQSKTHASTELILNFNNSRYFKIIGYTDSYVDLQNFIDRRKAMMALVIPKDFSQLLHSGEKVPLQLLVDGSDANTATIALGYAESIILKYNTAILVNALYKYGFKAAAPIDLRQRVWFNEDLKSRNFIIPGLIVVIMMVIAALLTSLTVAREWERGTMEQLLSTPVRVQELVWGKFIPYFIIGFFDLLIAVAMAQFIYHVPLRGSLTLLFVISGIFLTGVLMQGMLISITAKNQHFAAQMAILTTFMPAFLLSGFAYPIANMPKAIQMITYLIPARYFIVILRGIYLKGVGISILWLQVVYLMLFAFIMVRLAVSKLKKKVA